MQIFPAIDIRGGACVRLFQGAFDREERVAEDAVQTALGFRSAGCTWVHMVDLDGSVAGVRVNADLFLAVARESGLQVQLGGGIRSLEDIEFYLSRGIARVILGSIAVEDPDFVKKSLELFGSDKIIVGVDARNECVATHGWQTNTSLHYLDLAKDMEKLGIRTLIFTDISKDGTLQGPNFVQLEALQGAVGCDVIASGGVSSIEDIHELQRRGLFGAICGKSLYAKTLSLPDAVKLCEIMESER